MDIRKKQNTVIFVAIILIVVFFSISNYVGKQKQYILSGDVEPNYTNIMEDSNMELFVEQNVSEKIIVHIEGHVVNPGVYELDSDSRTFDAIDAAGGILDTADRKQINLAKKIVDEEYIYIPSAEEISLGEDYKGANLRSKDEGGTVNINSASASELTNLPGIGSVLADRIIEYRGINGLFKSVEDLKNVSGIGDKKFSDLKDKVKIR